MRRLRHRPANLQRQVQQLDLFVPPNATDCRRSAPEWRQLPEETRRAVTNLFARLLLDGSRADRGPTRMEATDDV
jgi:hypothetical protein